ncbi:efflux RND transporter permease subunit [Aquimarina sp. AD1]|uniref:efflux RND transporter permease subunit n=1 Tax=Aquimarina sp. (strain AD1) TaxID=1714848 RepID=UPI000E508CD4|nr:efflux RND transporter permease subunit [Aquimarina sp. AD1]AXT58100.1 efflux RND transporter permease subunit [Aquimarina sp. AD1]RKN37254.1 efflux RND transporter permease subunit [Aquimarina sp. AD1]
MKNFLGYFIKYPVAVNIFIVGFLIFGFLGYQKMNSSFFPLSDAKTIQITVTYPGASPEEVEEGVVEKIERNLKGIIGIDRVSSVSQENSASVIIEILSGFDINLVLDEVKNAVDRVPSFPKTIEPPVIETIKPTRPAISFIITGKDIPLRILKEYAQNIENDLLRIDGISQISLTGFPDEEIEISISEAKLRNYNLTFEEVAKSIAEANISISGGSIKTKDEEFLIRADNKRYFADNLNNIVIKSSADGSKVYLRDIAKLNDTFSENPDKLFYNGEQAVQIDLKNTNSEDLISSVESVKNYIKKFNTENENIELKSTFNTADLIEDRISLLLENAIVGMLLVLILLSFFLRPSVAFWVAFGLPISFFGMFILLPNYGVTLNMLSMFGMILVIGILVDDGIVIAENIYSRRKKGESPIQAAVNGTLEVLKPILSAITTTILAFSVFFFLDGQIGDFFGDIALVVTLTLLVSLIEALLILPSHLAHSKDIKNINKISKFNKLGERFMDYLLDKIYIPVYKKCLQNKFLSFTIIFFLFIITIGAFTSGIIKLSFFPTNASDQIVATINTPQGTSERVTDSIATYIENNVWKINKDLGPNEINESHITGTVKRIGSSSSSSSITINLSPSETRSISSIEITDKIRASVGNIPILEKLSFNSGANVGGAPISVSLQGKNIEQINKAKEILYTELSKNPNVKDIIDSSPKGIKEINLKLKDNAQLLGLSYNSLMTQVRNAFYGNEVQRIQRGQDEVKIWVRYDKQNRSTISNLNTIEISTSNGRVPLSEVASYTIERGEVAINHLNGIREVTVEADIDNAKVSAADIMMDLKTRVAKGIEEKYLEVTVSAEGQNREVNKIADSATAVFPAIIFLIYVVIVFTFRSFSQPFILLALIPFSIIGVAWGHYLHGFPMSILSYLGIVGLIGIVVNDGLVFTNKFNSFLKEGLKFEEALYQTGRARFRAIFLTSITTIAGLAPLMLERSLQAQFLIPMAIAISYGIAIATILTLFILPIFLSFSNTIKVYIKYIRTGKKPTREEVERAIIEQKVANEKF